MYRRLPRLALATLLAPGASGCALYDRSLHLTWPPPGQAPAPEPAATAPAVTMTPVIDLRPEPRGVVGAVRNGFGGHTANVVTPDDVAAWTGAALVDELRRAGVRVVEAAPGVPQVGVELRRAWGEAFWSYSGDVVLRAWLRRDADVPYNAFERGYGSAGTNWAGSGTGYTASLSAALSHAAAQVARGVAVALQQPQPAGAPASGSTPAPIGPPPAPAEPPELAAPAPPVAKRPVNPYLAFGHDFGFTKLLEATYSNGNKETLRANGGLILSAGATFLQLHDGMASTRATLGLKYDGLHARNGAVTYLAFPVEVVEQLNTGPVRLAGGLSLALGPRLSGSGVASSIGTHFEPSVGLLLEARYVFGMAGARGEGMGIGPRFLWQRLRDRASGVAVDANALGLVLDWTL